MSGVSLDQVRSGDLRALARAISIIEAGGSLHGLTDPETPVIGVTGPTGAGKSTLAKLVARLYDPTAGVVRMGGVDLRRATLASLRRRVVVIPQEGFLFSGTVRENIAFGRPDAGDEAIYAAAEAVGADVFVQRLPQGYETQVGERGGQLSAGQRQLIAFARALVAD
ncbi:MAG: ATP-binding cassette domain-containing protein, partial [Actinobacteria bacterium]|nr:ATP-binding cassette domain-containing protein [Actinomycetota bacterium]